MTEKSTPEERFEPLPEVRDFASIDYHDQFSNIRQIQNFIDIASADEQEKLANYFFLLKSIRFNNALKPTTKLILNTAGRIPNGDELKLVKILDKKSLENATEAITSILHNIAIGYKIEKNDFDTIKKIVDIFLNKNESIEEGEILEEEKDIVDDFNSGNDLNVDKVAGFLTGLVSKMKTEEEKANKAKEEFEQKTQESFKELQTKTNLMIFANEVEIFKNAARQYFIRAMVFLTGAIASLVGLICIAIFVLYDIKYSLDDITIGKTLLVVLFFSALGICMRGYFLNSHNEAHNRHRSNVLRAYKNIYENTEKDDRKEVVTQTLSASFQQLPTGFSKQQGNGGSGGLTSFLSRFSP